MRSNSFLTIATLVLTLATPLTAAYAARGKVDGGTTNITYGPPDQAALQQEEAGWQSYLAQHPNVARSYTASQSASSATVR